MSARFIPLPEITMKREEKQKVRKKKEWEMYTL